MSNLMAIGYRGHWDNFNANMKGEVWLSDGVVCAAQRARGSPTCWHVPFFKIIFIFIKL
jgi:hypothetical protein